ncbi:TIGR04168 family protein [Synechocystis sp. LKSZ1]|uniref:TIGR04168 family protein n=1 Tax=Synechocystis sp. LKSZ1 TaxID=3144951 RepID=UPI00336C0151
MSALYIAVVGDIHDLWNTNDHLALQQLGVDLVLFVGDLGNESLPVVRSIAALDLPKAVVLGNHDAWYTASSWGRKKAPYDHGQEDRVQTQLTLLAESHVGYGKLDFLSWQFSVVGSRPFSWGGPDWKNKTFLRERYGVTNFRESILKMVDNIQKTQTDTLIFLGHNGPWGLGDQPESICGRDWQPLGGDHGDPDFSEALLQARQLRKRIPLVAFGHMHHRLRHRQDCLRTRVVEDSHGTVYLNAACVPRIRPWPPATGSSCHHFSLIHWQNQQVQAIESIWMDPQGHCVERESIYARMSS